MVDCGHPLLPFSVNSNLPQYTANRLTRGDNKYPVPCAGDAKKGGQTTPQPSPRTSHLDAAGNNHKERKSEQAKEQTIAFLAACCLLPVHVLTGAIRTRQRRCLYRSQVNVAAAVESTRTRCNSYQEQHFKSHYFLAETAPRLNAS